MTEILLQKNISEIWKKVKTLIFRTTTFLKMIKISYRSLIGKVRQASFFQIGSTTLYIKKLHMTLIHYKSYFIKEQKRQVKPVFFHNNYNIGENSKKKFSLIFSLLLRVLKSCKVYCFVFSISLLKISIYSFTSFLS